MLKLYEYQNPNWGLVFKKFSQALFKYAPDNIYRADTLENSDVQLIHIVGMGEIDYALKSPKLAIWQHCYKTAGNYEWEYLWDKAMAVFSCYKLNHKNLVHLPLGYDENIYYERIPYHKRGDNAFVTGHVIETENIDKVWLACKNAGYTLIHTGEDFTKYFPTNYVHLPYMDEYKLAELLSSCKVVFGLREVEGFEQHVLEGIACGAVGVVPTLSSYDWYEDLCPRVNLDNDLQHTLTDLLCRYRYSKYYPEVDKLPKYTWKSVINKVFSTILERI